MKEKKRKKNTRIKNKNVWKLDAKKKNLQKLNIKKNVKGIPFCIKAFWYTYFYIHFISYNYPLFFFPLF